MSYIALYRKFRPDVFDEVKGQDAIVTTLRNQVRTGRTGHAYLFCGTRGTGKTTLAKIFAKAINCESPVDGNPCGKCPSCQAIAAGQSMNVIEIDAASNNGVDNIREIREEVTYRPTQGRYKVYIIDEVHMLSTSAFNALLKTLEEPPEYVVFILATTEARSILPTITSRCQRYDFKRMTGEVMIARLKELMEREGAEGEDAALEYIARKADGSMRDAISLLDQCLTYYPGERLTYDHVLEMIGTVDTEVFEQLYRAVLDCDAGSALTVFEQALMEGREATQLLNDFAWFLRNVLLCVNVDDPRGIVDLSTEQTDRIKNWAADIPQERIISAINTLSEAQAQIRLTSQKKVLVEMTLIKLCTPAMSLGEGDAADRIAALEAAVAAGAVAGSASKPERVKTEAPVKPKSANQKVTVKTKPEEKPAAPASDGFVPADEETVSFTEEADNNYVADTSQDTKANSLGGSPAERVIAMMPQIRQGAGIMLRQYLKEERFRPHVDEKGALVFETEDPMNYNWLSADDHRRELEELISRQIGERVPFQIKQIKRAPVKQESLEDALKQIKMEIIKEED